MLDILYFSILGLLLAGMLAAMSQMRAALDDADLERFSIWTCVAAVIAFLPVTL